MQLFSQEEDKGHTRKFQQLHQNGCLDEYIPYMQNIQKICNSLDAERINSCRLNDTQDSDHPEEMEEVEEDALSALNNEMASYFQNQNF